jgi:hypothetical protein
VEDLPIVASVLSLPACYFASIAWTVGNRRSQMAVRRQVSGVKRYVGPARHGPPNLWCTSPYS